MLLLVNALLAGSARGNLLATSGFNDASGINSNPTANSPFEIGVTVHGQGVGEAGWDLPWERHGGFSDRAPVSTEFVYEGDAAVKLFADNVFGTSIERAWSNIQPIVRVDQFVLARPAASMSGQVLRTGTTPFANRLAAQWQIEENGNVTVFDTVANNFVATGFTTLPNAWNKYSVIVNTQTQTWEFLFNDQPYEPGTPLGFLNPLLFVDRVSMSARGNLNTYVDSVSVNAVPEPSSICLSLVGMGMVLAVAARRRGKGTAR